MVDSFDCQIDFNRRFSDARCSSNVATTTVSGRSASCWIELLDFIHTNMPIDSPRSSILPSCCEVDLTKIWRMPQINSFVVQKLIMANQQQERSIKAASSVDWQECDRPISDTARGSRRMRPRSVCPSTPSNLVHTMCGNRESCAHRNTSSGVHASNSEMVFDFEAEKLKLKTANFAMWTVT